MVGVRRKSAQGRQVGAVKLISNNNNKKLASFISKVHRNNKKNIGVQNDSTSPLMFQSVTSPPQNLVFFFLQLLFKWQNL